MIKHIAYDLAMIGAMLVFMGVFSLGVAAVKFVVERDRWAK